LSVYEYIIMQEAGVKQHDSASPPSVGLRAGAFAEVGTLILTNLRLIYVAKGSISRATAWALGGAIAARAVEKSVSQAEIDDLMRYEGSYFVPLQEITHVQAGRKLGGGYLSVLNCSPRQKPAHSYVFGSGFSKPEEWANAINQAVIQARSSQTSYCPQQQGSYSQQPVQPQQTYVQPPPQQPVYQAPPCPFCGSPLTWIPQYQRWYCYRDQRYP